MGYFPLFTDIAGQTVLIYGGGKAALEKVQRLLPFGARLVVTAPRILPEILAQPRVEGRIGAFSAEDLEADPAFVIAAGEDREENRRVSEQCRLQRIPVNAVDDPPLCTFYFPALISEGALTVGISTGGKSPAAAVLLREEIQSRIPERVDEILEWICDLRPALQRRYPDFGVRRALLRKLVSLAFSRNRPLTDAEVADCLREADQVIS